MSISASLIGIGECMVELSEDGSGLLRRAFAGDVFNTLWYARRSLDDTATVRFMSAVGTDPLSDEMLASIEGAGIDTGMVRRVPDRRPGLYMIHLDGAERSFSYWRDSSAARLLASDRGHLSRALDAAEAIYFSGITLAILPPDDADAFLELAAVARSKNKVVAFDPNIRPALWPDKSRMQALLSHAAAVATIVLPSFDDESSAFGDPDPEATISRYLACNAGMVVLKNGAGDVLVQQQGAALQVFATPPVSAPVDTTGAGDSFNGAFLAEFIGTEDLAASVRAGQACAAEVICHRGALIAHGSN